MYPSSVAEQGGGAGGWGAGHCCGNCVTDSSSHQFSGR